MSLCINLPLSLPTVPLPCIEDRPRPSQQDRRNTCRPFSKHYATCGVTFFWTRLVLLLSSQLSVCIFFVSSYAPQSPRHKCPDSRVAASMGLCCMQHMWLWWPPRHCARPLQCRRLATLWFATPGPRQEQPVVG